MCATGSKIRAKNKTMRGGGGREVLNFVREKKNYIFFTHLKSGSVFESTDPVLGPRFLLALRLLSHVYGASYGFAIVELLFVRLARHGSESGLSRSIFGVLLKRTLFCAVYFIS